MYISELVCGMHYEYREQQSTIWSPTLGQIESAVYTLTQGESGVLTLCQGWESYMTIIKQSPSSDYSLFATYDSWNLFWALAQQSETSAYVALWQGDDHQPLPVVPLSMVLHAAFSFNRTGQLDSTITWVAAIP